MKQRSLRLALGITLSIVVGFGITAGIVFSLRADTGLGYNPPEVTYATKTGSNSATLNISAFPDSQVCHPNADAQQIDWVSYCEPTSDGGTTGTSLEVPPNSTVTVIIKQYDSSSTLINDYFRQVRGTIGGSMTVNGKPMNQISADAPGHTFTLQSNPDATYPIFVSVPLLGVPDDAPNAVTIDGNQYPKPNVISFQFQTGPPGTYIWHCYVPCGSDRGVPYGFSGAMSTTGFMAGTLDVASY